jgi:hypothetical protein
VPINVVYELEDASVLPGEEFSIPLIIRADAEVQGYHFSIDFDEEVLQAVELEAVWQKPPEADPEYAFLSLEIDNSSEIPGSAGVDEGFVVGAAVFEFTRPVTMPANTDNEAVRLTFLARADAPVQSTAIRFLDGSQGSGRPVPNKIIAYDVMVTPEVANSFVFVNGVCHVQPDITVFIRGDSNGDAGVDLSDAVTTLDYLFIGNRRPHCYDAADADDDGVLDITDPVFTLNHLFLGGSEPPPPYPEPGEDLTPDGMTCNFLNS